MSIKEFLLNEFIDCKDMIEAYFRHNCTGKYWIFVQLGGRILEHYSDCTIATISSIVRYLAHNTFNKMYNTQCSFNTIKELCTDLSKDDIIIIFNIYKILYKIKYL